MQPAWLYLIGHNGTSVPTTHINASDDPFAAVDAHNAGQFKETKHSAGHWTLMLLIYVPAERGLDMNLLVQHWRDERRTLPLRLSYGISMAAKLMLLCFVNGDQLRAAKFNDKQSEHLLRKVLAKIDVNRSSAITPESVSERVARYLQTPRIVYEARNGTSSTTDWLRDLNTLKRRHSDTVCFSRTAADAATPTPAPTPNENNDNDDNEHEHNEPVAQATANVKRAKKSMTVVNGLVSLQQSVAFNDASTASSAQALMTNNVAPVSTGAARRRQRNSLFSSHGTVDARTLSLYGDALCVDMGSSNTLANMRVVGGENDRRCVCGTPRLSDDELVSVVLVPDSEPVSAHRCNSCGRLSATYERYCIDSSRANRSLRGGGGSAPKDRSSDAQSGGGGGGDEVSASNDSLDLFVQTLLVSFNDAAHTNVSMTTTKPPASPKKIAQFSRARKRLFDVQPASQPTPEPAPQDSMFVFGNRSVQCKHASLTEVSLSNNDTKVIKQMIQI